jgi:hypothetical protein
MNFWTAGQQKFYFSGRNARVGQNKFILDKVDRAFKTTSAPYVHSVREIGVRRHGRKCRLVISRAFAMLTCGVSPSTG